LTGGEEPRGTFDTMRGSLMTYDDDDAYFCEGCGTIVDNPEDMENHKHGKDK
jgi:hypothetical protein